MTDNKRSDLDKSKKEHLQTCISLINSEAIENDEAAKENELKSFWDKRKKEACMWGIIITTSNTVYQVVNIISPKTPEQ